MKKILILSSLIAAVLLMASCGGEKREPGLAYMPDMFYSRAYETYAALDSNKFTNDPAQKGHGKIFYNFRPVAGTVARGEMAEYVLKNDSAGYAQSAAVANPLSIASVDMKDAERLYLVNCGICHGSKLDGNGPLFNNGDGPFKAAPKNLMGDDMKKLTEGTMFHSLTFGKGSMGSYASQLSTKQRWEVIAYIKMKQGPAAQAAAPVVDSVAIAATK